MSYYDETLRGMLGGRTIHQFASLPPRQRQAIFRSHLVQKRPVIIEEGDDDNDLNPHIASGVLLRQQHFMGDDDTGKRLVEEAREIYYGENHFNVRLHWLREFMSDYLGDHETKVPIAPFIKKEITIVADLHDSSHMFWSFEAYDADDDGEGGELESSSDKQDPSSVHYRHGTEKLARWTQKHLKDLLLFTNAKQVNLLLCGRGLLDGSDLATHKTLKDISYAVKLLIDFFGDRFSIKKMIRRGEHPSRSLTAYWESPTEMARQGVRRGEAAFKHVIQVEMEEWTQVFPPTIGPWMEREILI